MSKPSSWVIYAQEKAKLIIAEQTGVRLAIGKDAALIAAHEVMQLGPGRAAAFLDAYNRALEDLSELYLGDNDKLMDYGKGKRDEVIRKIVGDENFVSYDKLYRDTYLDELKRIRVLTHKEDKK